MSFTEDQGWYAYVHAPMTFGRTARLVLGREFSNGRLEIVNLDGSATVHEPGYRLPEDIGWEIPIEAVGAIGKAIERFQGDTGHAATEVRVLREWLQVEQSRVNDALRKWRNGD